MDQFTYRDGTLHAEEKSIEAIAADPNLSGTPFYCYSRAMIEQNARNFADGVKNVSSKKPLICFAVKANCNPSVISLLGQLGYGADVTSKGEILVALDAGIPPERMVYSGTAKTDEAVQFALEQGILQFNVEHKGELGQINAHAKAMGKCPRVAIRVNPNIAAGGDDKISTGKEGDKFGVPIDTLHEVCATAKTMSNLRLEGISVHIGSQIKDLSRFRAAYEKVRDKVIELEEKHGISLNSIDLGGGLGVQYDRDPGDDDEEAALPPIPPRDYGKMVTDIFKDMKGKEFIFEPGRTIVADAGILVTKVLNVASAGTHTNVKVDAAMNDFMRPAMYSRNAKHKTEPVKQAASDNGFIGNVVGASCESSDVFRRDISLPGVQTGDLLVIRTAGAYGASMSNNYNSRPLLPEVIVDGDQHYIVRRRQTYEEMRQLNMPVPLWRDKWSTPELPTPGTSGHPGPQ